MFLSKPLRYRVEAGGRLHSLDSCKWTASRPGRFVPEIRTAGAHGMGYWVSATAGLDILQERKTFTILAGWTPHHPTYILASIPAELLWPLSEQNAILNITWCCESIFMRAYALKSVHCTVHCYRTAVWKRKHKIRLFSFLWYLYQKDERAKPGNIITKRRLLNRNKCLSLYPYFSLAYSSTISTVCLCLGKVNKFWND